MDSRNCGYCEACANGYYNDCQSGELSLVQQIAKKTGATNQIKKQFMNYETFTKFLREPKINRFSRNLKPITASIMVDDGGEKPYYCVMAAYASKEDALEALERIS